MLWKLRTPTCTNHPSTNLAPLTHTCLWNGPTYFLHFDTVIVRRQAPIYVKVLVFKLDIIVVHSVVLQPPLRELPALFLDFRPRFLFVRAESILEHLCWRRWGAGGGGVGGRVGKTTCQRSSLDI